MFDPETIVDIQRAIERLEQFLDYYFFEEAYWASWDEEVREWQAARKADHLGCYIRKLIRMHTEWTDAPICD